MATLALPVLPVRIGLGLPAQVGITASMDAMRFKSLNSKRYFHVCGE